MFISMKKTSVKRWLETLRSARSGESSAKVGLSIAIVIQLAKMKMRIE